eukprot:scaffold28887_cov153-Isochrysis_galbana.AAC.1
MSGLGSPPHTASGAVVASGRPDDAAVECDSGAWPGPSSRESWCVSGTRSAPLLGVAYGSGPETATDPRSCGCALPLSESAGLTPGSDVKI